MKRPLTAGLLCYLLCRAAVAQDALTFDDRWTNARPALDGQAIVLDPGSGLLQVGGASWGVQFDAAAIFAGPVSPGVFAGLVDAERAPAPAPDSSDTTCFLSTCGHMIQTGVVGDIWLGTDCDQSFALAYLGRDTLAHRRFAAFGRHAGQTLMTIVSVDAAAPIRNVPTPFLVIGAKGLPDLWGDGRVFVLVTDPDGFLYQIDLGAGLDSWTIVGVWSTLDIGHAARDLDYANGRLFVCNDRSVASAVFTPVASPAPCNTDMNSDGTTDFSDVFGLIDIVGGAAPCPAGASCDISQDGATDFTDVFLLIDIVGGLAACP